MKELGVMAMEYGASFESGKNVLKLIAGWLYNSVDIPETIKCTLSMGELCPV